MFGRFYTTLFVFSDVTGGGMISESLRLVESLVRAAVGPDGLKIVLKWPGGLKIAAFLLGTFLLF